MQPATHESSGEENDSEETLCCLCHSEGADILWERLAGNDCWLALCPACMESVYRPERYKFWLAEYFVLTNLSWAAQVCC